MKLNIGIPEKNLEKITEMLSVVLADNILLYTKTRKFHWNVKGENFMELHKLFESQYKELEKAIDEIAERISKLGSSTIGTLKEFLGLSNIKENPANYPSQKNMLKELLTDHELIISELRKYIAECDKKYNDFGTTDFLIGLIQIHETIAWTLRRYLC